MSGCSAIGALCKLAVQGGSGPRTFSAASERYSFISEDIKPHHVWRENQWGIGEIAPTAGASKRKATFFSGTIIMEGSRANMEKWLPRALWGSSSSPLGVSSNPASHEFDILVDRENGTFRYIDCLVNSLAIFSDTKSTLCYLMVGIVAKQDSTSTMWPTPEPPLPITNSHYPFCHFESTLQINSTDIPVERVGLTIHNKLAPIARRSLYAQKFRSQGREIRLSGISLFDVDAYPELDFLLNDTADGIFSYSSPSIGTVTFNFQNFQNIQHETPATPGKEAIPVPFQLRANKDNLSTAELTVAIGS